MNRSPTPQQTGRDEDGHTKNQPSNFHSTPFSNIDTSSIRYHYIPLPASV
jgi:hypothetical protein